MYLVRITFIFLFLKLTSCYGANSEAFYMCDVGQGNCQLAIYHKSNIGVLYDSGSLSTKQHPKIEALTEKPYSKDQVRFREQFTAFYEEKTLPDVLEFPFHNQEKMDIETPQKSYSIFDPERNYQSMSHEESIGIKLKDLGESIQTTISNHNLKFLFVFLSHPDKDHINLTQHVIPENLPSHIFLCGDWLGDGGASTDGDSLSKEVQDVFNFIKKRSNIDYDLPHYYGLDIPSIKYDIKEGNYKKLYEKFRSSSLPKNDPLYFHGSLAHFCNEADKNNFSDLTSLKNTFPYEKQKRLLVEDLNNIYIHSINGRFNDINSQSPIISMTMDELKVIFICTGDATDESFYHQNFNKRKLLKEDYLRFLILPHHGSITNISDKVLSLFEPDVIGISAGNGGKWAHPSVNLINNITQKYKPGNLFAERMNQVGSKNELIMAFLKVEKENKAFLYKTNELPVICTNILGTILIDKNKHDRLSFNSLFSTIVYQFDVPFKVDFTKRDETVSVAEFDEKYKPIKNSSEEQDDSPLIFTSISDREYYYKVYIPDNQVALYKAEIIPQGCDIYAHD